MRLTMSEIERAERLVNRHIGIIAFTVAICGFLVRIYYDFKFYLDRDEALHYTLAIHPWHG